MSRSRKDGRRRGGHTNTQNREVWSRRCPIVNMWDVNDPDVNRITSRWERRRLRRELRQMLQDPEALTE